MLYRYIFIMLIVPIFIIPQADHTPEEISTSKWFGLPTVADLAKAGIRHEYPVNLPSQTVSVQNSTELCPQEKIFLENRVNKVQQTLQKEFNINKPLKIAFCCGGGGNRAMIGSLGIFSGAAKSKVLDASLYAIGLSGSTWFVVPFCYLQVQPGQENLQTLSSLQKNLETALSSHSMLCYNNICTPPLLPLDMSDDFLIEVMKRYGYDQPLTLVNLFGPIVADYALSGISKNWLQITWSSIAQLAQNGTIPLPLCSSIYQKVNNSYGWFEMSPFQAGSKDFGYIPVQYLGSKFKDGNLDRNGLCPEYPLSFYLGMYGSAFAVTIQDITNMQRRHYEAISVVDSLFESNQDALSENRLPEIRGNLLLSNSYLQGLLKDWIETIATERNPIAYAQFNHFEKNSAASNEVLGLFDAGIDFNLPVPLVLDRPERAMDIIIIYDSNPGDARSMQKAYAYAIKNGLAFPGQMAHVTIAELNGKTMTIFNDPQMENYDIHAPTIIYFPTKDIDSDNAPYTTFNFKYLPEQVRALSEKMEQAFLINLSEIKRVMQAVALKRYGV